MIQNQTLRITIPENQLDTYIALLYSKAKDVNYNRLIEFEEKLLADNIFKHRYICLQTPRIHVDNQYLEATIWLSIESNNIVLRNITSNQRTFLSAEDYNIILNKFYNDVVLKSKIKGVRRKLSKPVFDLRDVMGEKCADALMTFSNIANKDSSLVNETDIQFWAKFIKLAHMTNARISGPQLEEWLRENGWRKIYAEELASYYEYSISLLRYV